MVVDRPPIPGAIQPGAEVIVSAPNGREYRATAVAFAHKETLVRDRARLLLWVPRAHVRLAPPPLRERLARRLARLRAWAR